MFPILLLLIALFRWFRRDRVSFYLILQFLVFRYYYWLPVGSVRNDDLALLGVMITSGLSILQTKPLKNTINSNVRLFLGLLVIISVISLFYYKIPAGQVISGCRQYLFVLCLFDIRRMEYSELCDFFKKLFYLNVFACFLFIAYTLFHIPIYYSGYNDNVERIGFMGIKRTHMFPTLAPFVCLYAVFVKGLKGQMGKLYGIIAFGCLLCIQSRGVILNMAILIVLGYLLVWHKSKSGFVGLLLIAMVGYSVNAIIFSGDTGTKTMNDLSQILSGDVFQNGYEVDGQATFTYRLTLLVSTIYKMIESSIVTLLFGFGFFIELSRSMMANLGLLSLMRESWDGYGLFTPDISYVNILCYLGFFGGSVYLRFFYLIAINSYRLLKAADKFALMSFLYVIYLLLIGLDGSSITYPSCLLVVFLLYQAAETQKVMMNKDKNK